ncbi:hypothetical protein F8S09_06620 [Deinococcus sp. SDU3-2]|uniref:Uncharacterized protein n=1 Tax=Deinococcus terrestris TaxID=2651870 RepID=A0A7X1TR24_9DEIO|nr:hypothetical protein [Deinococcus terrestris]MPY66373.1 hypothetical protein [Deinococcus terrestris]
MWLDRRLELLRLPAVQARVNVDDFDGNYRRNAQLAQVRAWRNQIVHNAALGNVDVTEVDDVVRGLLAAFPFGADWAQNWVREPERCPVSAASLSRLVTDLQGWLG